MIWFREGWTISSPPHPVLDKQPRHMVSALEGLALLVGLRRLLEEYPSMRDTSVNADTDSMVCALGLRSMKIKSPQLKPIRKELAIECIQRRIDLHVNHIPGTDNEVADAISRSIKFKDKFDTVTSKLEIRNLRLAKIFYPTFWKQKDLEWIKKMPETSPCL